ncbi:antitoxin [Candidatus Pacearchaeota archaeon]|nr:MAG: antitoxin [Candidatus Pacearchaeota archaeon]
MVNALIKISEDINKVLNIVKAKYGFKDKGEAIEFIIQRYIEQENEPDLRPEFIERMKEIERQKSIEVDNFLERYL